MGMQLAKAWVMIGASSQGLRSDLHGIRQQVDNSVKSLAAGAEALFLPMKNIGVAILAEGLRAAMEFERASTEMETLIGNAREAQQTMKDLTKFAMETPFEMPQVISVATNLALFGERGEHLMETLRILGDVSGGLKEKFQILGIVFNQIRGVGHLLTQDFRQLAIRGIISMQDLANHFKVPLRVAQEMLSAGKISFASVREVLKGLTEEGGRFNRMMERQAATLHGLVSIMKDAVGIAARLIATPLMPWAKFVTQQIISLATSMEYVVKHGGEIVSFALAFATAMSILGTVVAGAALAMSIFNISLKLFVVGFGIAGVLITAAAALGAFVGWLYKSIAGTKFFGDAWESMSKWVRGAIEQVKIFVAWNQTLIDEVFFQFEELAENIIRIFEEVTDFLIETFKEWTGISEVNWSTIGNHALQWLKGMLELLILLTTDWELTWALMVTGVELAFYNIANSAIWGFNQVIAIAVAAAKTVWSVMQDLAHNIGVTFELVVAALRGMFMGLWDMIKKGGGWDKGDFLGGFQAAFNKELLKAKGNFKNVGADARKTFNKAFEENKGPQNPLAGMIAGAGLKLAQILAKMKEMRDIDRLFREIGRPFNKKEEEEKKKPLLPPSPPPFMLEAGRYGFAAISDKIQDSLLGKGKNYDAEAVDLAKQNLQIQEAQLKELQNGNKIGGGGLGE